MGEYRYAVVELPPSPYARDLQEVLAFVFDIGVNLAGCTGEQVAQAFMASGLAEEFEKQNPVYVAGKSSYDLLRIMVPLLPCDEVPAPCLRYDRTPGFLGRVGACALPDGHGLLLPVHLRDCHL